MALFPPKTVCVSDAITEVTRCWHDLDNTEYDCWPMEHPDEHNMIDCAGLDMSWVVRPPAKVRSGEEFNVTYALTASDDFYQTAVTNGILKYSNASEAKRFCEEKECPINWKDATESNCCVYHANIHSCPLAFMLKVFQECLFFKCISVHSRELDHPNLCKFIGGSVEIPSVTIITEYCPKGSLVDVLFNDDIPLNWGFRLSFATDLARGMAYLHQHRIYHGRLHSMNCIIDDRWVCKISDYGLAAYRKDDFEEFSLTLNARARRIYSGPEVFTGLVSNVTPTADVYSYSIILLEIATRCEPVSGDIDLDKVAPTWRPYLPEINDGKSNSDCPNQGDYTELIKRCWAHNPLMRPTFEQIKKMLEKMNPNKVSPVDKMMNLMEKYSKHLESIVAERTQDLLQEKQKTDSLLYSMLPKQVADDLRQGITSQAQSYSNATVFFSDIVGFTQLSSASTPYQVVDFLNRLYTCFDAIIDNYDVYKVETIGDAYMVVSGVPKENGIKHAAEIASMALDLVAVCSSFIIPHKPDVKLKIRAGIHSGPLVAGVVGTKMPRYCLFGDTVNTASRMESTSEGTQTDVSAAEQRDWRMVCCLPGARVKDVSEQLQQILKGEKEDRADECVAEELVQGTGIQIFGSLGFPPGQKRPVQEVATELEGNQYPGGEIC
ncbi:atrial natriuretic peptide receptor 2-like [Rhincodon typus]|uniref:atrial natriuretic peptide receptor 2-like n=1 Tax=Rhincodon typus TaxID=259920 RepID=UPI0020302AA5|nr:atrial natriuretic peptide receptor 2-like [Rhincodon typus]